MRARSPSVFRSPDDTEYDYRPCVYRSAEKASSLSPDVLQTPALRFGKTLKPCPGSAVLDILFSQRKKIRTNVFDDRGSQAIQRRTGEVAPTSPSLFRNRVPQSIRQRSLVSTAVSRSPSLGTTPYRCVGPVAFTPPSADVLSERRPLSCASAWLKVTTLSPDRTPPGRLSSPSSSRTTEYLSACGWESPLNDAAPQTRSHIALRSLLSGNGLKGAVLLSVGDQHIQVIARLLLEQRSMLQWLPEPVAHTVTLVVVKRCVSVCACVRVRVFPSIPPQSCACIPARAAAVFSTGSAGWQGRELG
jgi:hypothetical protein